MSEKARTARRLLHRESVGVLGTHSVDVAGYPFGSIAPYALDYDGEPVMLISDIAQHTRNIKRDARVSLTVFERLAADPQSAGRLTWIGDATPVDRSEGAIRDRYLRYFPSSASYFEMHDFSFYRIRLKRARFIGGFGQIFWIEPGDMLAPNPFRESEDGIVEHMNDDHQKALAHYCSALAGIEPRAVAMTGIDGEGFDMLADGRKVRVDLDAPIRTPEEARAALVRLAKS
jgi:putative heme iron utilization protein